MRSGVRNGRLRSTRSRARGLAHAIGTTVGPAATVRRDKVLLTWKGAKDDSQIYFSLFDGTAFTGQVAFTDGRTSFGPGVTDDGGRTFVAWKGMEDDNTIWWKRI